MRLIKHSTHVIRAEYFDWQEKELRHSQDFEFDFDGVDSVIAELFALHESSERVGMKTVRLQYEIPEDRLAALDELMAEAGIKTRSDLFNNATTLLRWAIRQRKEGRAIASIDFDDKSFRELEMPIFENIKVERKEKTHSGSGD